MVQDGVWSGMITGVRSVRVREGLAREVGWLPEVAMAALGYGARDRDKVGIAP